MMRRRFAGSGSADQVRWRRRPALERRHVQRKSAAPAVEEPVPKRASDRTEGKRLPWNLGFVEQPDLEAFRAGTEIAIAKRRTEHHVNLIDLREADHRVESAKLDARVRFFQRLAERAGHQRFAVFEKSRRQRPQTE